MPIRALMLAAVIWTATQGALAAAGPATVPLRDGSNPLSFGAGAPDGMAVLGHRENFNAHSFDVLSLYIRSRPSQDETAQWQLVSLFDGDAETLFLTSGGGADCKLHDFRLVRDSPSAAPRLIVARRDMGASYADAAPVHFKYYVLRHNSSGEVGRPLYYFALERQSVARQPYCDVGDAFQQELGIKAYR